MEAKAASVRRKHIVELGYRMRMSIGTKAVPSDSASQDGSTYRHSATQISPEKWLPDLLNTPP